VECFTDEQIPSEMKSLIAKIDEFRQLPVDPAIAQAERSSELTDPIGSSDVSSSWQTPPVPPP
jgi:hypothetical protein